PIILSPCRCSNGIKGSAIPEIKGERMKKYKWIIDFALTYIILIIAASVIMTGCSIQKRLDKYCPLCPVKIERKDSIIVKIEEIIKEVHIRDTVTVTKYLPNPCAELCDEHGQLKP